MSINLKSNELIVIGQQISLEMRRTDFLCQKITSIPNFANQNSNLMTFQKGKSKKNPKGIPGIENRIGIPLPMGVPEIGTKNWNSQPSCSGGGGGVACWQGWWQ